MDLGADDGVRALREIAFGGPSGGSRVGYALVETDPVTPDPIVSKKMGCSHRPRTPHTHFRVHFTSLDE